MAKQPKGRKVSKVKSGFDLDDLLEFLGKSTGQIKGSGRASYGSAANAAATKAVGKLGPKLVREADSWTTGGLGSLGYDLATGKPMTAGTVGVNAGWGALNFLPVGKLAKVGGPAYKTARSATEAAKQLRMLNMILGGE